MTAPIPAAPLTAVERAIALREVEAFRRVPMEQLVQVAAACVERRFDAGELLFRLGDPPSGLWVVLDGVVGLEQAGTEFARVVPGEALGTWSLFDDHPRRATARVAEPSRLLELDRDAFYEVLGDNTEIIGSLVQDLVRRLVALTEAGARR